MATNPPIKKKPANFGQVARKAAPKGPKKLGYWSFSAYSRYKQCPQRSKFVSIDKLKEPGNKHMDRGNAIHESAEFYIKGKITKRQLHEDLLGIVDELDRLRKIYANRAKLQVTATAPDVEDTWAFTADWSETVFNDWIACVVRIKLDCGHWEPGGIYVPTDWKSGKFREEKNDEYVEQLELYALGALLMKPHAKEVRPRLVYTDECLVYPDPEDPLIFTHDDIPRLKALWAKRTKAMLNDTRFAPRPGWYCNSCHFRKANGGPCKY